MFSYAAFLFVLVWWELVFCTHLFSNSVSVLLDVMICNVTSLQTNVRTSWWCNSAVHDTGVPVVTINDATARDLKVGQASIVHAPVAFYWVDFLQFNFVHVIVHTTETVAQLFHSKAQQMCVRKSDLAVTVNSRYNNMLGDSDFILQTFFRMISQYFTLKKCIWDLWKNVVIPEFVYIWPCYMWNFLYYKCIAPDHQSAVSLYIPLSLFHLMNARCKQCLLQRCHKLNSYCLYDMHKSLHV